MSSGKEQESEREVFIEALGFKMYARIFQICDLMRGLKTWLSRTSQSRSPTHTDRIALYFCAIVSHMLDNFPFLAPVDVNSIL